MKDITEDVSLTVTEATNGFYEKEVSKNSRIYHVLEDSLKLKVENESETLEVGDSCFISQGTEYEMIGIFKAIVVNQPIFGIE